MIVKSIVDWFSLLYYKPIIYFDLLPFAQHIHVFTDPDLRQNFWNEDDKARFNYVLFNNYQEYHKQGWYYHVESDIIFCSGFFCRLTDDSYLAHKSKGDTRQIGTYKRSSTTGDVNQLPSETNNNKVSTYSSILHFLHCC